MRLIRFGELGREHPGVLDFDNRRLDVSAFGEDWNEDFFGGGGLPRLEEWFAEHSADCPVVEKDVRLGPCVVRPSKIVCIGLDPPVYLKAGDVVELGVDGLGTSRQKAVAFETPGD